VQKEEYYKLLKDIYKSIRKLNKQGTTLDFKYFEKDNKTILIVDSETNETIYHDFYTTWLFMYEYLFEWLVRKLK